MEEVPQNISVGDLIVARLGPKVTSFAVSLAEDLQFTFRTVSDYSDLQDLKRNAAAFAKQCRSKEVPQVWYPYLPDDNEAAASAFLISELSIEPKITQLDALKIAKGAGLAFETLVERVNAWSVQAAFVAEAEEVEAQKKDLSETPSPSSD